MGGNVYLSVINVLGWYIFHYSEPVSNVSYIRTIDALQILVV